jgi:hypothetical protein
MTKFCLDSEGLAGNELAKRLRIGSAAQKMSNFGGSKPSFKIRAAFAYQNGQSLAGKLCIGQYYSL